MDRQRPDCGPQKRPHNVSPGSATIDRLQNPGSVVTVLREVFLAGTHVNRVRVTRVERDGTGGERWLIVRQGRPVRAAIGGLPNAALSRPDIDHIGTAGV